MPRFLLAFVHATLAFAGVLAAAPVHAAAPAKSWTAASPHLEKEAYFSNLQDGASIETPFVLKFGLSGVGLAPIARPVAKTGHHHLLVNRGLPMDFDKPLPFNDQYIHFGKGQMQTVLNFAPGTYTLRLVLADDKHIPTFVYSKPISITVTKKNAAVDPKSLVTPGVSILPVADAQNLRGPFRLALHASGLNVSNTALAEKGTGHFRLTVKNAAGREETIPLANGHTETWLSPPPGAYSARVEFIDNTAPDNVLASSEPMTFRVP